MTASHPFQQQYVPTPSDVLILETYDEFWPGCTSSDYQEGEGIEMISWCEIHKIHHLGEGSFADVSLVKTPSKGIFALKCLKNAVRMGARSSDEFLSAAKDLAMEGHILSKLNHKNIIRLRGLSTSNVSASYADDGNGYFILLDVLVDTLRERMIRLRKQAKRNHRFPLLRRNTYSTGDEKQKLYDRLQHMIAGVAEGMSYLHNQGFVLRDLKPGNIGFDDQGEVRIFDFGMARKQKDCCDSNDVCGTLRYMAPEIMQGQKGFDFKSDVYSFGVTLYEVASLKEFFPRGKRTSTVDTWHRDVLSGERPSLGGIPCKDTRNLIRQCWDNDQVRRPSFEEICARLDIIIQNSSAGDNTKRAFARPRQVSARTLVTSWSSRSSSSSVGSSFTP